MERFTLKSLIILLLIATSLCAAPVPKATPPDPLGVPYIGINYYAGNLEEYNLPRMWWVLIDNETSRLELSNIDSGTLAYRNGFRTGDQLKSFQNEGMEKYFENINMYRPGAVVNYTIIRDGKEINLKIILSAY